MREDRSLRAAAMLLALCVLAAGRGGEPGGRGGLVRFRCFGPILGCFGDS